MKLKNFIIFALCMFYSMPVLSGAEDISQNVPSAFLPADHYEFSAVLDGAKISHDYIIQNRGTASLLIEKVKTG